MMMEHWTIIAILAGPVLAVGITRWIDHLRDRSYRRMELFRTLIGTRRMQLSNDHVGALNLVEIEFQGEQSVLDAWKEYLAHLGKPAPTGNDKASQLEFRRERDELLARLLHAMAKVVGVHMEQLDILRGGYLPVGWLDDDNQMRQLRLLMIQLLSSQRALPVVQFASAQVHPPYPPPPRQSQSGGGMA